MISWIFSAYVSAQEPEVPSLEVNSVVQEVGQEREERSFVSIHDSHYDSFRAQIDAYLPEGSFCALFVNRMLKLRYGIDVYGDAWTMQLHPDNTDWLNLLWRVPEDEFNRSKNLSLYKKEDRIKHYKKLYQLLDTQVDPQGVAGFVYYYSFYREKVAEMNPKHTLAQTHVGYIGGRKQFSFTNKQDTPHTLEEVIADQYGALHEYEKGFASERVHLETVLEPGDEYFYEDYLFEENYKGVRVGSLFEVYLRKHRNNRITPLLRPNSYSQISEELQDEVQAWN